VASYAKMKRINRFDCMWAPTAVSSQRSGLYPLFEPGMNSPSLDFFDSHYLLFFFTLAFFLMCNSFRSAVSSSLAGFFSSPLFLGARLPSPPAYLIRSTVKRVHSVLSRDSVSVILLFKAACRLVFSVDKDSPFQLCS